MYICIRKSDLKISFGTLDEWLSQRSAKPSTAVRICQVPHESPTTFDVVGDFFIGFMPL